MKRLDQFKTKEEAIQYIKDNVYGCATTKFAEKYLREKLPKESYYQKKIIDYLNKEVPNCFAWKEAAGPYSRQGIPDVSAIINGRYFGFEVKRPFIGVATEMQKQTIEKIRAAGGVAEIVTYVEDVRNILIPEFEQPLTLEELKGMAGQPVWCPEMESYGIIKCDKIGSWAGRPYLYGSWYNEENGLSNDFEYDIQRRELKCYRVGDAK